MDERIDEIVNFWFEGVDDTTVIDKKALPFCKWFMKDERFDEIIRREFSDDLIAAADGQYKKWEDSPKGRLALILLFDQFSRNMCRDTPGMYTYDALALKMTLDAISEKQDQDLPLIERIFLYMPLMHCEDAGVQELSLEYFTRLVEESKETVPGNTHYYEYTLKYAREHYDDIARSGRFPYRDKILKRSLN